VFRTLRINAVLTHTQHRSRLRYVTMSMLGEETIDRYGGVTVKLRDEQLSVAEFEERLRHALELWTAGGRKGVWITVSMQQSAFVPVLVQVAHRPAHTHTHTHTTTHTHAQTRASATCHSVTPSLPHTSLQTGGLQFSPCERVRVGHLLLCTLSYCVVHQRDPAHSHPYQGKLSAPVYACMNVFMLCRYECMYICMYVCMYVCM
jgi:hypothetical protein